MHFLKTFKNCCKLFIKNFYYNFLRRLLNKTVYENCRRRFYQTIVQRIRLYILSLLINHIVTSCFERSCQSLDSKKNKKFIDQLSEC
jgi:hypothetical protein